MNPSHESLDEGKAEGSDVKTGSAAPVVEALIAVGKAFHSRNWVLGAAGSFSGIACRQPFQLAITRSAARKEALTARDFLLLDETGKSSDPGWQPPAETPVHRTIMAERDAGAVLHTHSVWSTILSDLYADPGGLILEGFEMLKGLSRVKTHLHTEWLPILENFQNYTDLSRKIAHVLKTNPGIHGILLRKCGFYTWGRNVAEAVRHAEIFEFLFEVLSRQLHISSQDVSEASGKRILY